MLCSFAKATPKMHWAVNLAFNCNELETFANGEVSINSKELTTVFVADDDRSVRRVMTGSTLLLFMERLVIFSRVLLLSLLVNNPWNDLNSHFSLIVSSTDYLTGN